MFLTDPIADMLTRIRNANRQRHESVVIPASKEKMSILNVLVETGYIVKYDKQQEKSETNLVVELKYVNNERVIHGLKRISKPGLRVYAESKKLPRVLNGLGIAIVSTSKGVLTDKQARINGVGGEIIAYVW